MLDKSTTQRLRSLPVEAVAERLGLRVVRHKSLCPFHDDHHASLSYSTSRNTFRCFVCDARGGTIDLVMRHLNMSFPDACLGTLSLLIVSPRFFPLIPFLFTIVEVTVLQPNELS